MTTRRQLLERAAKAAGYALTWKTGHCKGGAFEGAFLDGQPWRPLDDDGDALRLAVKLGLLVYVMRDAGFTAIRLPGEHIGGKYDEVEIHGADPYAATRLAIVRAAAALADER